jgi:membrane-bound lytic murein transglycosylase A
VTMPEVESSRFTTWCGWNAASKYAATSASFADAGSALPAAHAAFQASTFSSATQPRRNASSAGFRGSRRQSGRSRHAAACSRPRASGAGTAGVVAVGAAGKGHAAFSTGGRGRLQAAAWRDLPDWRREPLKPALEAFLRGCVALEKVDAWKTACAAGKALPASANEADVAAYFEAAFQPHQVVNPDDSTSGMVTGYYEPLLRGSRTRSSRFRYPLYAPPQDMLTIDLGSLHPDLKNRRLRGRIEGNRVVPYLARGDIDRDPSPLGGLEIAWAEDPVEVFFLHIQGSGQVELENGERLRVGYADQNGHPFKSLGRLLIDRGELPAERASMQGIKEWARRNPAKTQEFMNANPSYVFFRELPRNLTGPLGALGVPLTPERSIAVDPRVVPLGSPVYLATTWPNAIDPLQRLVVAQDTGGAIAGAVRVDFFWGFGDAAGALAGRMRQSGRMWVLLPKGYNPPAP